MPQDHLHDPRPFRDFAAAIGFLTLLPFGRTWADDAPPRSVGWYPWVGWILGGLALGVALGHPVVAAQGGGGGPEHFLTATVIVAMWAVLTRFLHWDGIADSFDGLWGGQTPERRLEIMRDSRIGSFGAASMLFTALLQVAVCTMLLSSDRFWAILAAPVLSRFAVAVSAWTMPSARREGLGLTAMDRPGLYDVVVAATAVLALIGAVAYADPARGAIVVLVGLAAGAVVPRVLARPVGGMTGDLFGATVLLVELVVLLTGVVV